LYLEIFHFSITLKKIGFSIINLQIQENAQTSPKKGEVTNLGSMAYIVVTTYFLCFGHFYVKKGDIFLKKT